MEPPSQNAWEYPHDGAVAQACWIALLVQLSLALTIGVICNLQGPWTGLQLVHFVILELGLCIFLNHCLFFLPSDSPNRMVAPFGSFFICLGQTIPFFHEGAIMIGIAYAIGLFISGWILHRISGASLSMGGEPVYQNAISIKVLLVLAPLQLLQGLLSTVVFMLIDPIQVNGAWFASTIIYSAFGLLLITCIPIILMYGGIDVLRMPYRRKCYLGVALVLLTGLSVLFDITVFGFAFYCTWCLSCIATYFLGIAIAYAPFHTHGFRPVWAKRRVRVASEQEISFDDVT